MSQFYPSLLGPTGRTVDQDRSPSRAPGRLLEKLGFSRQSLRAALLPLLVALGVMAIVLSFRAEGQVQRQLFVSSAIVLLAVGARSGFGTPHRISKDRSMIQVSDRNRHVAPSNSHVLVDGSFSGHEAQEILLTLLDSEINLYKLQSLRSHVCKYQPDSAAERRIAELESTRSQVQDALARASSEGRRVRVHSTVRIEIETDSAPERRSAPRTALV